MNPFMFHFGPASGLDFAVIFGLTKSNTDSTLDVGPDSTITEILEITVKVLGNDKIELKNALITMRSAFPTPFTASRQMPKFIGFIDLRRRRAVPNGPPLSAADAYHFRCTRLAGDKERIGGMQQPKRLATSRRAVGPSSSSRAPAAAECETRAGIRTFARGQTPFRKPHTYGALATETEIRLPTFSLRVLQYE
ncbi:hypothetical protein EVAR_45542_1 [Eumeta japonica]|uniref:Uncharacterized protein n=1 Tax=Eumeta variegata TaxID=151549 RepID=A0A4C1X8Z1_EUMVA|nr:hypothetical protein EVAR_45542_1 [Eumeta japonica]